LSRQDPLEEYIHTSKNPQTRVTNTNSTGTKKEGKKESVYYFLPDSSSGFEVLHMNGKEILEELCG